MNSLFLTTCFFITSISLIAQPIADAGTQLKAIGVIKTETKTTAVYVTAHNDLAFTQITNYLKEHLEYPVDMMKYALDGTVTAAVIFSEAGEVANVQIAKSDLPEAFDQELTKTLFALKKLKIKGHVYKGNSLVYVPVHFSL